MSASLFSSFREALARVINPTQLQIYNLTDGRVRLQIVAGITGVPTIDDDGRVHCVTNALYRKTDTGWLTESAGDLVIPGKIEEMAYRIIPEGRLVLDLGLANVVIVIFPGDDSRAQTQYSNDVTISLMDLQGIARRARLPQIVLDTGRPPDDC